MQEDNNKGKFKELLDKLQQESWQLELLISGFAIFGLISALSPLKDKFNEVIALEIPYMAAPYRIAILSCSLLIINLIIHVILRGLWIGAIGLRYVSNEIDYEELNYGKRFTKYLKKKVGSFDDYIEKLENYCSILFAVTFLTLFYIISFFAVFTVIYLAGVLFIESKLFSKFTGSFLLGSFSIIYLFLALLIFIDFITQGFLKKKEWTSFLYMPIYKMFSFITLSFLYRPLVYNFLDNKFGRRIAFILVPLYVFIFYITTLDNVRSNYVTTDSYTSINYSVNNNYLSLIKENNYIKTAAIQSKIITKPYIKLFIPFKEKIEDYLIKQDSTLKPKEDKRGFESNIIKISFKSKNKKDIKQKYIDKDSIYSKYLGTFNANYLLKLDTLYVPLNFMIATVNNQLGFETVFPLKNILEGKHILKIKRNNIDEKSKEKIIERVTDIPFWYYKD